MNAHLANVRRNRWYDLVMVGIALHSSLLGVLLMADPRWLFGLFGWDAHCDLFFLHQVGIFHVLMGAVYAWEYFVDDRVAMVTLAKASAVVFLSAECLIGEFRLAQAIALLGDFSMLGVVLGMIFLSRRQGALSSKMENRA